jgi:hypothetical protein
MPAAVSLARNGEAAWTTTVGPLEPNLYTYGPASQMVPMIVVMHASDVLRNGKRADNLAVFSSRSSCPCSSAEAGLRARRRPG